MENDNIPSFLMEMLKKQYGDSIAKKIIQGYKVKRHVTFRVNTLKTDASSVEKVLQDKKIKYERVSYNFNAFIIKNVRENVIRDLDIYKRGEIYLQSLSSMLPPILLNPQEGTDILDMAAAPGGKTTQIAALTNNNANITACEINKVRADRLKYNIEKQGATSTYIMNKDARYIDDLFSFDQILLDAPCSGSGTLNVDNFDLIKNFTPKLINKSVKLQKAMVKKAINILKPESEMIYSTCSILKKENEDILQDVLQDDKVEIVDIYFKGIKELPLLPTKIKGTLCISPNKDYEGFFVAKLKKHK